MCCNPQMRWQRLTRQRHADMERRGARAATVLHENVRVVLRRVRPHLQVQEIAASVHDAVAHRHVRRGRALRAKRERAVRRSAERAVLHKNVRRRAVLRVFRVVIRPWSLAALHDHAVVVDGDVDVAHGEAPAFVDVDGIRRRSLESAPLRILQDVGENRAVEFLKVTPEMSTFLERET